MDSEGVRRILKEGSITVGVPSAAAVILALLAGGLTVLNEVVWEASTEWHAYIAIIIVFLAGVGVSPLVGESFRVKLFAYFHLPAWVSYIIASGLAALVLALSTLHISQGAHATIAGILTVFAALGFGPAMPVMVAPTASTRKRLG